MTPADALAAAVEQWDSNSEFDHTGVIWPLAAPYILSNLTDSGFALLPLAEIERLREAARLNRDFGDSRGFLGWVIERFAAVYGESTNVDWMLRLDALRAALTTDGKKETA